MHKTSFDLAAERADPADKPARPVFTAIWRGICGRCPACGSGRLFTRYLKVAGQCPSCGEALHHHRADDAPPYFTILIAGHVLVPLIIAFETLARPALWVHAAVFAPLTVGMCLALLPMVKGGIVGLQWALYMHGFDPDAADDAELAKADHFG